jgi:hypothetical protein
VEGIARGTLKYLTAATAPGTKRILFVDGPAVLGWERWRSIDDKHFSPLIRSALEPRLKGRLSERELKTVGQLIAGATLEAALICATSDRPERAARDMTEGLILLLKPLLA